MADDPKTPASKPPEGIHDKDEARVVSLAPDVCLTPCGGTMVPVPYNIYDLHGHDAAYTPTVRYQGLPAMVLRSHTTHVHGDEAGTGGGVVSGTHGGICEPITFEPTVRNEGSPAIRDGDLCWMNNKNTIGKCVLTRSTAVNQLPRPNPNPPPPEKSWWEKTKEAAGKAVKAVGDFDAAHGAVLTRSVGGLQAIGGGVEAVVGVVGGVATSETGVGALAGGAVALNGADNFQAGLRTAWTGQFTNTVAQNAAGGAVRAMGGSDGMATAAEVVAGIGPGGVKGVASGISKLGKAAEETATAAKVAEDAPKAADSAEAAATAVKQQQMINLAKAKGDALPASDVLKTDRNGVRISKTYRRPSWRVDTKKKVWENAKTEDGKVYDPKTGAEIKPDDPWHMGHEPGYEFWKMQESAQAQGLSREQFLDMYNEPAHIRPELGISNVGHEMEAPDNIYLGD